MDACGGKIIYFMKNALWPYFKSKISSRHAQIHPLFESCMQFLVALMKVVKNSINGPSYDALKMRVKEELDREFEHIDPIDRENGWLPLISTL